MGGREIEGGEGTWGGFLGGWQWFLTVLRVFLGWNGGVLHRNGRKMRENGVFLGVF
jgi:hypothetical protein